RMTPSYNPRERLVRHVQHLERLQRLKQEAGEELAGGFLAARNEGLDTATLKVVLKLRQMSPQQRQERRALEAIYLAALGMLEGETLPEAARRRLDGRPATPELPAAPKRPGPPSGQPPGAEPAPGASADPPAGPEAAEGGPSTAEDAPRPEPQPALPLKDPEEARQEGAAAALAGGRIYDNPYPAGDQCRAAWDEGWCAELQSNGLDLPAAYQRRSAKPPKDAKDSKGPKDDPDSDDAGDGEGGDA
ncbi:MAG: GapR family DNA-binding domain-containing protein, partial [Vicinamibacterales bacterium]